MQRTAKIAIGLVAIGATALATKVMKAKSAKKKEELRATEDKVNYGVVENLILEAERLRESDEGKRALSNKEIATEAEREEIVDTLTRMYVMYNEAEKYLAKIHNTEDKNIDGIKILITRRKKVIKHRRIFLNK